MPLFRAYIKPASEQLSFWAMWDSIIRRDPSSSQQLVSYLRTMTFTGVPAECTRFCINNYYNNYVVLFLRPTDNLVFDSTTGKAYYPECYRTDAFTPSNNGTQAVSLKSASGSDYLNSPRSSEYGSNWCSVPMNNFDMLYSDNTIAWQQNALLTDLNTTQT